MKRPAVLHPSELARRLGLPPEAVSVKIVSDGEYCSIRVDLVGGETPAQLAIITRYLAEVVAPHGGMVVGAALTLAADKPS